MTFFKQTSAASNKPQHGGTGSSAQKIMPFSSIAQLGQASSAHKTQSRLTTASLALGMGLLLAACSDKPKTENAEQEAAVKAAPALTVSVVSPSQTKVTSNMQASGNVAAWQEASIGAEVPGLRLTSVRANVGDWVQKGQLLATFEGSSVAAQTAELEASIAEAKVNLKEAQLNAARFNELKGTGAVSEYQISQANAAAEAASKRLSALNASQQAQAIRSDNTRVVAPDSGLISARNATVGAVVGTGAELFRLIRGGRLEWQGEVTAAERAKLKVGMPVRVTSPSGLIVNTRIRALAPSVNAQTRKSLIYADLPASKGSSSFAAGMFVKGSIALGEHKAQVLPRQAVVLRDGFYTVFAVRPDHTVNALRVTTGEQLEDSMEIVSGLPDGVQVVLDGAGFLNDGDAVKVVTP